MKYFIPLLFLATPVSAQEVSPFEACLQEVRASGGDAFAARHIFTRGGCCAYDRDPVTPEFNWCDAHEK